VTAKFDRSAEIEWSRVRSLCDQRFKYLPTSLLYFFYRSPAAFLADSNGCAAGNTLEEHRRGISSAGGAGCVSEEVGRPSGAYHPERSPIFSTKGDRPQIGYVEGDEAFNLIGRPRCKYSADCCHARPHPAPCQRRADRWRKLPAQG
jgi:YcaO cyclodehydratase, ATP-ad Mg2+-binding